MEWCRGAELRTPVRLGQGIAWEVEPHLAGAPLAWGWTREHPLAPDFGPGLETSQGGWRRCGGFLQLIPPIFEQGHPALVASSEPSEGMRRR